ncbi:MAG: hypothetical protein ACLFTK_07330 [Anaerolineales bacterium]
MKRRISSQLSQFNSLRPLLLTGLFLLCAAGLAANDAARAQAPPPEDVRGVVQAFLLEQLAREAVVLEFSFEGVTWPDAALGCPQPSPAPAPQPVAGYQWFFLMDDGVRYAVHSDVFGAQAVLCAPTSQYAFTYSTYDAGLFSVEHPNLWTPTPLSAHEFRFSRAGDACAAPTMRVLATSTQDNQPATLVSSYLAGAGLPPPDTLTVFASNTGSTTLDTLCEGLPLRERVTGIPGAMGVGFVVVQRAPAAVFNVWAGAFTEMLRRFIPGPNPLTGLGADLSTAATPRPTVAPTVVVAAPTMTTVQDAPPPTFTPSPTPAVPMPPPAPAVDLASVPLAHVFTGDVYIGRLNNLPGLYATVTPNEPPRALRTSADGLQLAYISAENALYTVSLVMPEAPNEIDNGLAGRFPPAWAPDRPALAYWVPEGDETYTLRRIFPDGTRDTVATLRIPGDCRAPDDAYTVERLYARETGPDGNGLFFAWLPNERYLFSSDCAGVGLSIYDAARDEVTSLGDDLRRAQRAPDGARLAALNAANEIVVFDLNTLQSETFAPELLPVQLGWDITSTQIFYSTSVAGPSVVWDDAATEARARAVLGVFPFESRQNTLSIRQLDTLNRAEAQVWNGSGFEVGYMTGAPDGSGLVFSLIPSDRGLLTNFGNGADPVVLRNSRPETQLWWVPLNVPADENINAQLLIINSGQPRFGAAPN